MDYPVFSIKEIAEVKSKSKELEKLFDDVVKCTPQYIADLPYDLRTNDPSKLNERLEAIDKELERTDRTIERVNGLIEDMSDESIEEIGTSSHNAMGVSFRNHWRFLEQELSKPYEALEGYSYRANGSAKNREAVIEEWTKIGLGRQINKIYKDLDKIWDASQKLKEDYEKFTEADFDSESAKKIYNDSMKIVDDYKELEKYTQEVKNNTPKEKMTQVIPSNTFYNPISVGSPRDWIDYLNKDLDWDYVRNTEDMPNAYDRRERYQKELKEAINKRDNLQEEKNKTEEKLH